MRIRIMTVLIESTVHVMLNHTVKEAAPGSRYVFKNDKLLYTVFADTPQCH